MTGAREVFADAQALAHHVADWLLGLARAKDGRFALCLSGGSTPKRLYEILATAPYRDDFPWSRTHLFWGDERFVPHDDALSNYRMVHDALLTHVDIPSANIHAVPAEHTDPVTAALAYERDLKYFYGNDRLDPARPLFDVVLLGLGEDGHTASLFPGTAVLDERERWVAPVIGAKAEARITLTYPALESAAQIAFLVEGDSKRAILRRLEQDPDLPAARLHPTGHTTWFLDRAAVGIGN
jgi:6-phosphogluconolactonase